MSGENYNPGCDGRPGRPSSRYPPWEYQESPNPRRYLSHHDYYDGYGSRRQQDYIPRAYQLPSLARGDPDPYLLDAAVPRRPQQAQGPGLGYPSYRPDHSPIKSSSSPSSRGDINKDQQLHQRPHFGPTENQRIAVVKPIKHSASAPSTQDQRSTEGVRVGGIPVQTQTSPWHQMPSLPGDPGVSTSSTPRPSTGSLPPLPGSGPGVTALNITPPVKQEQHLGKHITSLSKTDSVKDEMSRSELVSDEPIVVVPVSWSPVDGRLRIDLVEILRSIPPPHSSRFLSSSFEPKPK
ncbi:unnamed protein product [Darwinula stevensoni]|uniref:Uncharacterized protein n=1 Tax=Darwinula stevensoni TaxID=69355 RepID=A0A7R9AGK0_9CRUS|nr:unnamed protein product [Darwinula stevensoni]CAG0904423.1 unnamed protein product [Darwinula stevensoni]